jgi:hypothetical protein
LLWTTTWPSVIFGRFGSSKSNFCSRIHEVTGLCLRERHVFVFLAVAGVPAQRDARVLVGILLSAEQGDLERVGERDPAEVMHGVPHREQAPSRFAVMSRDTWTALPRGPSRRRVTGTSWRAG